MGRMSFPISVHCFYFYCAWLLFSFLGLQVSQHQLDGNNSLRLVRSYWGKVEDLSESVLLCSSREGSVILQGGCIPRERGVGWLCSWQIGTSCSIL